MKTLRLERDVKHEIKKLLDQHKWFWWMPTANAFGRCGISDFHALRSGVFIAIEAKHGNKKPSAQQNGFLNSIETEGGFAFCVATEEQLESLAAWLAAFDRSIIATQQGEKPTDVDGSIMINAIAELTMSRNCR